jgi:hypothetical protein
MEIKMAINVEQSIFTELADFLVTQPSLKDLANYKVSAGIQHYLDDLLERNREDGLSAQERLELEKILALVQMMDLAKAKAQLKLAGN